MLSSDHARERWHQIHALLGQNIGTIFQLLHEIKARGFPGSMNLLIRDITQARVEGDRPPSSPSQPTSVVLTTRLANSEVYAQALRSARAVAISPSISGTWLTTESATPSSDPGNRAHQQPSLRRGSPLI